MLNMSRPSLKMISVRDACNLAPPGPQKNEALRHYVSAVEARLAMKEAESNKELDAAAEAISWLPRSGVTTVGASEITKNETVLISRICQRGPSVPVQTPLSQQDGLD